MAARGYLVAAELLAWLTRGRATRVSLWLGPPSGRLNVRLKRGRNQYDPDRGSPAVEMLSGKAGHSLWRGEGRAFGACCFAGKLRSPYRSSPGLQCGRAADLR